MAVRGPATCAASCPGTGLNGVVRELVDSNTSDGRRPRTWPPHMEPCPALGQLRSSNKTSNKHSCNVGSRMRVAESVGVRIMQAQLSCPDTSCNHTRLHATAIIPTNLVRIHNVSDQSSSRRVSPPTTGGRVSKASCLECRVGPNYSKTHTIIMRVQ